MQVLETVKKKWAGLPRWAKWLVVGVGVLALGGGAAGLTVSALKQGNPLWSSKQLGTGSLTIGRAGCFLTALTIVANRLAGKVLTPDVANDIIVGANGFAGSNLNFVVAAQALGVRASESDRIRTGAGTFSAIKNAVDRTLDRGGLPIVHVDRTRDATGDHFIVIHQRLTDGSYKAMDPANGKDITLSSALTGMSDSKTYQVVGVAPVFRS